MGIHQNHRRSPPHGDDEQENHSGAHEPIVPLLCAHVDTKGHGCDKGNACRFCHTPGQVREIYKTRKCTNWWYRSPGRCARGALCRFRHDEAVEERDLVGAADAEREAAQQAVEQESRQWNDRVRGAVSFVTTMILSELTVDPGDASPQVTAMINQEVRNAIAAAKTTVYHRLTKPDTALAATSWRPSGCSRAVFDASPHQGVQGEDFDIASQLPEDLSSCYMCT